MRINSLQIENFKVFNQLDLQFDGKSTILFGVNGVGKSSVLSAIAYIFRVFLNQINPAQSKAFESFQDDAIHNGCNNLHIRAEVSLEDIHLLARAFKKTGKNTRLSEPTYPKVNYAIFRDTFRKLYLENELIGMPVFVYYGTNRAVLDIPDRIRVKHHFDKLSALERAIDQKTDFRTFFEWFRDREADEILRMRDSENHDYIDSGLSFVRKAVETMIGDVKGLTVKRSPIRMVVEKAGREIRVDMLSDGEKCTLAMLGDLARRLILANPALENPLEGKGIVLIDEIELHMHPVWQRRILGVLKEIFPNIQFIVTTHSPQVLGEADDAYRIISLSLDDDGNGIAVGQIHRMDGFDSNMILEEYMGASSVSKKKKELVHKINEAIRMNSKNNVEVLLQDLLYLAGSEDEDYILLSGEWTRRQRV